MRTSATTPAATDRSTTASPCSMNSPKPIKNVSSASPARRSSLRQRQQQLQQPMQVRQELDEDESDDLILCNPIRHPDRRRNRQTLSHLDQQQHQLPQAVADRSHSRYWHRQRNRSRSPSNSKHLRPSSQGLLNPLSDSNYVLQSSMFMTREEYEALPPTVQRKYFSTLERLRFAQTPDSAANSNHSLDAVEHPSTSQSEEDIRRPPLKARFASDPLFSKPYNRPRVYSSSARLCSSPADKLHGRSIDGGERHPPSSHSHTRSVILDATDEAFVKLGKRQSQLLPKLDLDLRAPLSPLLSTPTMSPVASSQAPWSPEVKTVADSFMESFQWLEQEDDLDLRLSFDDYNFKKNDMRQMGRRPSFRRHLSISKLHFSRPSESFSRPATRAGTLASPALNGASMASLPAPNGHVRRRSRALSLINPNKAPVPSVSSMIDPAASHYQDPEARMKLRVYLASPHKFDEAIEFGFPAIDEVQDKENVPRMRSVSHQPSTGLAPIQTSIDDELESMSSGPTSPTESTSPRTPESMDQSPVLKPMRIGQDVASTPKIDYAQAPASSREMTLRMTLTRPDLRANEEQIYGWKKGPMDHRPSREANSQPRPYTRGASTRDTIEKQFDAFDQENIVHDDGVMKRFWNRVRRS